MNKITKKKFRVKNGQDHSADVLEYFLKGISQAISISKRVGEFIMRLSVKLPKIRLELMLKDLESAKDEGKSYSYNTICCHLTSEEQEKLYVFLKNMFEEELKELNKDEKI